MKSFLTVTLSSLFACFVAVAHPGVGLVQDSKGNVYYTDLVHVWKIDSQGRRTIAVRNVHTHELALDGQDNLYGEDLQYEGEATNRWHHRIWKRTPEGRVVDLFGKRPGFRKDFGFARDRRGNQYFLEYDGPTVRIRKRRPDGSIVTLHPQTPIPQMTWLAVSEDGSAVYVTGTGGVYQLSADGKVKLLLPNDTANRHALMGIWPAPDGHVYVADFNAQCISRVDSNGKVTLVARTESPWAPSSMLQTADGAWWILEYSTTNEARLRRIDSTGKSRIY